MQKVLIRSMSFLHRILQMRQKQIIIKTILILLQRKMIF